MTWSNLSAEIKLHSVMAFVQHCSYMTDFRVFFGVLQKRLMNAAKKAITKMPLRTIRSGDRVSFTFH